MRFLIPLLALLPLCLAADPPRPRIHIYDLPPHLTAPCHHWGCRHLEPRLRASAYYEPDHRKADFFWIPHRMPFHLDAPDREKAAGGWAREAYALIASTWPYLNRSIAARQVRHFITQSCDHGPSDCDYVPQPIALGALPAFYNPADPARVIGHIVFNGRRDGADAGQPVCYVCFQKHKDIQMAADQGSCGPLCGYNLTVMRQHTAWSVDPATRGRTPVFAAPRPVTFFYAGTITLARGPLDATGRDQLLLFHGNRSGFRVVNTNARLAGGGPPPRLNFAEEMAAAEFCYSPFGQSEGETDRYVAAVMMGCIPVLLTTSRYNGSEVPVAQAYDEVLNWRAFAVLLKLSDLPRLHDHLAMITPEKRHQMRVMLSANWQRLLYSSMYGSYLGEPAGDGDFDAFEAMIEVMRRRLHTLPAW